MNNPEYKGQRAWLVNYALPKNEEAGRKWTTSHSNLVIASSIEGAIKKVIIMEPEATIWQVNHQGVIAS